MPQYCKPDFQLLNPHRSSHHLRGQESHSSLFWLLFHLHKWHYSLTKQSRPPSFHLKMWNINKISKQKEIFVKCIKLNIATKLFTTLTILLKCSLCNTFEDKSSITAAQKYILTGHAAVLQAWFSVPDPAQINPPFEGTGESQFLVLDVVPPPQVTLQLAQSVQDPQFPSKICLKISKVSC